MSFWDNVKKFTQPYADDEYDDEITEEVFDEEEAEERPTRSRRAPAFHFSSEEETENPVSSGIFNESCDLLLIFQFIVIQCFFIGIYIYFIWIP